MDNKGTGSATFMSLPNGRLQAMVRLRWRGELLMIRAPCCCYFPLRRSASLNSDCAAAYFF